MSLKNKWSFSVLDKKFPRCPVKLDFQIDKIIFSLSNLKYCSEHTYTKSVFVYLKFKFN